MSLRERTRPGLGVIEPCLPSPAEVPPSGPGWLHEIKHDASASWPAATKPASVSSPRHGNDFTSRFPIIVAAVTALPARSFLIGGEAIVTNGDGLAVFDLIRHKRHGKVSWCAGLNSALCLMSTTRVMTKSFSSRPASSAARASCRSDLARCMVRALAALDQDQESEGSGGEARSRRRLGP